jgi:hypothetical protein
MKLVGRKTKKAIEKSVRKAMKQHGPKIVAALAASLVSSIAALATTDSADKPGKSNLADIVDRAGDAVSGKSLKQGRGRKAKRKRQSPPPEDTEGTRLVRSSSSDEQHH